MNATMKEVMWELFGEEINNVISNSHQGLMPPGFRFHPTDEELITYYLASKVFNGGFSGVDIVEVDLNRCEPWELPDVAKMGENEWYFFSLRDRKYPTGLRTNRATGAGYWKATGKDREVHGVATGVLVGMKKTLVFYKGRAPRGEKTKWVLHEYRLEGDFSCRHACKEEWVICRIFNKSGGLIADHQKINISQVNNHYLDHPLQRTLEAPLQTLESPIQSLLTDNNPFLVNHDHHHNIIPQPMSFNPKSQQNNYLQQHDHDETSYYPNWLDVYLQQNPSGIYELAFGTCQLAPDFGPLAP